MSGDYQLVAKTNRPIFGRRWDGAVELLGRACMETPALEEDRALIAFKSGVAVPRAGQTSKSDIYRDERTSELVNVAIRGFIDRSVIRKAKDRSDIPKFNITCGKQARFSGAGTLRNLAVEGFDDNDRYQGSATDQRCTSIGIYDKNCGGRYSNYFRNPVSPATASVGANVLYRTNSSTAVKGPRVIVAGVDGAAASGVVRAVVRVGDAFRQYDQMTYLDPNVPCSRRPVSLWTVGDANP